MLSKIKKHLTLLLCASISFAFGINSHLNSASAATITIKFDEQGIMEGQIIDTEYAPVVNIRADNRNRYPQFDLAVVFDSRQSSSNPNDPDLKFPWKSGNIKSVDLGNILIIEENGKRDPSNSNFIDRLPDDEGGRPAGFIEFDFGVPVLEFGFDLIDIENGLEAALGSFAAFESSNGEVEIIPFGAFVVDDPSNPYFVPGVQFGDNSANRISPFSAALLGLTDIGKIQINLGGSGGIDNIVFTPVPLPGAAILLFSGLLALFGLRQRVRNQSA